MRDAFSHADIGANGRLFVGVFNMPSILLLHQNQNFYRRFLNERVKYLWTQYSHSLTLNNNEYFYSHLNINNGLNTIGLTSRLNESSDFFFKNKQVYMYNVSIEAKCFASNFGSIYIASDNMHTLLVDDYVFDDGQTNVNFLANVKHFVLSPNALSSVKQVKLVFLRQPNVFKFGLAVENKYQRDIELSGLIFNDPLSIFDGNCNLTSRTNTRLTLANTRNTCTCQDIYFLYNKPDSSSSASSTLPCDSGTVKKCFDHLKNECKYNKNDTSFLKDYTKFWLFCLSESEMSLKDDYSKLHIDGFYGGVGLDDSPYAFSTASSLLTPSINGTSSEGMAPNNNLGKIVGLGIICFVFGLVLFMIAINLVQYKFRNDLLDDLECSSSHNVNSTSGGGFNRNYSVVSLGKNHTNHDVQCNDGLENREILDYNNQTKEENEESYFDEYDDEEFEENQEDNKSNKKNDIKHCHDDDDFYCKTIAMSNDVITNDSGKFSEESSSSGRIEEEKYFNKNSSKSSRCENRKMLKT
jgi:hypothetical protein